MNIKKYRYVFRPPSDNYNRASQRRATILAPHRSGAKLLMVEYVVVFWQEFFVLNALKDQQIWEAIIDNDEYGRSEESYL
jgi:hypothetical protein